MMDVIWTYFSDHFTIYVNLTIVLYALNLYRDVCQLFLNKIGKILPLPSFVHLLVWQGSAVCFCVCVVPPPSALSQSNVAN